jgi:sortase A
MSQTQTLNRKTGRLQRGFLLAGIVLLSVFTQIRADTVEQQEPGSVELQHPGESFVWIQDPYTNDSVLTTFRAADTSLWNAKRITDYEESLEVETAPPLGILTIDTLNIQVPIYNGTEEFILNRGAGRIKGMGKMDEHANLGISAHRDGFFRGLKDIKVGDDIQIQTTRGVVEYAVSEINIVPKTDVSVLDPTTEKLLTLVTCYPFYFVGNAPKRYIVTALPK